MENSTLENSTSSHSLENSNTESTFFTFSLGFGILLIIILFGILGSAFLCLSLEKDPGNLWPVESSTQTEENPEQNVQKDGDDTIAEIICA